MVNKFDNSFNISDETLAQLKQLIPEAFKDGLVDIGSLSDALSNYQGEALDLDDNLFGLYWPGKRQAKKNAATPPLGTLVPVPGDGVDEDTTKNIYIEGENLEVLKIIRKAYLGKINMIYIDPPYNTGKDFIYPDDFSETEESYKRRTGQIDENGIATTTNKKAEGRFHSKWCSMMYPRLRLARDLLTDDGVIFISIDDNEVTQLRKICDEIFGEDNIIAEFVWKCRNSLQHDEPLVSKQTERILTYTKNKSVYNYDTGITLNRVRKPFDATEYKNPDNDQRGPWLSSGKTRNDGRPSYTVISPTGVEHTRPWIPSPAEFKRWEEEGLIWWGKNGDSIPRKKAFLKDFKGNAISDILFDEYTDEIKDENNIKRSKYWEIGTTESGTKSEKELFNGKVPFDYPKPWTLIKYLITISTNTNDIILDFFSGSATTAHAVMKLNTENMKNRQFIMVQIQEEVTQKNNKDAYDYLTNKNKPLNISEIGKERIRLASDKLKKDTGLNINNLDLGFKVFRLSPSNFKPVGLYTGTNVKELPDWFSGDPLVEGWKPDNLITEVMLKEGFPLDSTITKLDIYKKNKVYQISSDSCDHTLIICLDTNIENDTIEKLDLGDLNIFICLDSAITDQVKARLDDKGRIIVI